MRSLSCWLVAEVCPQTLHSVRTTHSLVQLYIFFMLFVSIFVLSETFVYIRFHHVFDVDFLLREIFM